MASESPESQPKRVLSLFDSTSLAIGIIVGAGVYQMAPMIATGVSSASQLIALWLVGGLLSFCGALVYAELATALPEDGGDYVFLKRAYGDWAGFLFGWVQLVVVRPGDIAIMSFIFATYGQTLAPGITGLDPETEKAVLASFAVVAMTAINIRGVQEAKWTQNILTSVKALGLLMIVGLAFCAESPQPVAAPETGSIPTSLALIFVLFTFGGWNEMAYVSAEIKDPSKNISRALFAGVGVATVLYVLLNSAFLHALGFEGLANSGAVATDSVSPVLGQSASRIVSALVCISSLSAVHGLIFAGSRISYAVGTDNRLLSRLGKWNSRTGTPLASLILQAALALILILTLGSYIDAIIYTAAAVYSFQLATSLSLFVIRRRDPDLERPYRAAGYPFTAIIFSAACGLLLHSAIVYKPKIAGLSLVIGLLGLPIYYWGSRGRGGSLHQSLDGSDSSEQPT